MEKYDYHLKKEVNGEDNPYQGWVRIKLPSYKEKMKIQRDVNFSQKEDGTVEAGNNLDVMEKMGDLMEEYIIKMEVKKGKRTFTSFEELQYDNSVFTFVSEVGLAIVNGVDLGNE